MVIFRGGGGGGLKNTLESQLFKTKAATGRADTMTSSDPSSGRIWISWFLINLHRLPTAGLEIPLKARPWRRAIHDMVVLHNRVDQALGNMLLVQGASPRVRELKRNWSPLLFPGAEPSSTREPPQQAAPGLPHMQPAAFDECSVLSYATLPSIAYTLL